MVRQHLPAAIRRPSRAISLSRDPNEDAECDDDELAPQADELWDPFDEDDGEPEPEYGDFWLERPEHDD